MLLPTLASTARGFYTSFIKPSVLVCNFEGAAHKAEPGDHHVGKGKSRLCVHGYTPHVACGHSIQRSEIFKL